MVKVAINSILKEDKGFGFYLTLGYQNQFQRRINF